MNVFPNLFERRCVVVAVTSLTGFFPLIAADHTVPNVTHLPSDVHWTGLAPHPRLFTNATQLAALREQNDPVSRQLRALLIADAEKKLTHGPVKHPTTGSLMGSMRQVQGRILTLALAWHLTGDPRYRDRARDELLLLADRTDWGIGHFLGIGEAALAAGVGFDWLYEFLSPDERDRVTRAIVTNAIEPALATPTGPKSWVNGDFNWTQVCHGGVSVAALAIAEREPALARQVVERAITNFDRVGATYGPDGAYPEGPSYWSYGTSFHVILIEALRTALGTSAGLEKFPGFLRTGDYNNQMVGPTGQDYNYSDYHVENLNEPIMLWFARENRDRSLARDELTDIARALEFLETGTNAEPGKRVVISRHLPLELLWWDPTHNETADARTLHWTADGVLPLAVMRSAWDDPKASFLAIKGGSPNHSHGHMDAGSFILESDGVRWAIDLGTESYANMRKAKLDLWDYSQASTRWTTFRVGPEGHNILRFDGGHQNVNGKATIRALAGEYDTMGNVVDLGSLYTGQAENVNRTVRLHPDRSFTIDDKWTAPERPITASWQWLTRAKVITIEDGLRLEQDGQFLTLETRLPRGATIAVEDVSKPRATQDSANPGLSRIVITMPTPAGETARLTVRAIPGSTPD